MVRADQGRLSMASERKPVDCGALELTVDLLRQAVIYCPDTGEFTWRTRPASHFGGDERAAKIANARSAGKIATWANGNGYLRVSLLGQKFYAHRLAWLYMTGAWPSQNIDHKDGNKQNNRWFNLRDVSQSINAQNCDHAIRRNNSSGTVGVWRRADTGRWTARVISNKAPANLGSFATQEEAVAARANHLASVGVLEALPC